MPATKDSLPIAPFVRIPAPTLEADSWRQKLGRTQTLERTVVANLLAHLEANGWKPVMVFDSEENVPATTAQAAMNAIFAVDDSRLYVSNGTERYWVYLVCSNGVDIITDNSYSADGSDNFEMVMDAFDPLEFERQ